MTRRFLAVLLPALLALPALADAPRIVAVEVAPEGETWRFDVTVEHADEGWEHYADGWRVLAPDGAELGYRELLHPHVNEQPFTRSLSGVAIPDGLSDVQVRAEDSVHGPGPAVTVPLPGR